MAQQRRMWVKELRKEEKATIAATCERFISDVLKPRFLPEIRPTQFNFPVDIFGKWRGNKYSFIQRYRSGLAETLGDEFDAPFTRLDHLEENLREIRFDVMWRRHTGQWWRLHQSVTLNEALRLIEAEELLQPKLMGRKGQHRFEVEAVRRLAGDKMFARGQAYHRNGQVELIAVEPQRIVALVTGGEDYRAELTGRGTNIDGECSCPAFADRGFCKHLVATALAANDAGGSSEALGVLDRIRRHLATKKIDTLVEMIVGLAERDTALLRELDMTAAIALDDDSALFTRFREALDDATMVRDYMQYREVPGWAGEVSSVLDRIATLATDGRATLALDLAGYALSRIEMAILSIDDSDGYGGGLLERARDIHVGACGAVLPDPVALARELFTRELEGELDSFSGATALYADVLGNDGLAEYRRLATAAWDKLPAVVGGKRTTGDFSWERSRLEEILDFFAERDGDVDARIAIRASNLSSSRQYLELARFLLSHGRQPEALRRAEEALWLFEDDPPDEPLIHFTVDLLLQAGREADAQARLWQAFERQPSMDLYQRLRELAGEPARDRALAFLRAWLAKQPTASRWDFPAALLVRLLMAEAMYAEAWEAVHENNVSDALKETLATASEDTHPQHALAVYAARVDKLVSTGGNGNYAEAAV